MKSMTDLYWIACNRDLDLSIRYAAARQMQIQRIPEKSKKELKPYSKRAEKIVLAAGTAEAVEALNRTKCAIKSKRYRMRKKEKGGVSIATKLQLP